MKTIEVVAAIIEHEGRILATQRGYGDFKDGWEFPGGKMEPGETPEAAIVREIEEELKVTIAPKTLVTTVECDYPKFHLTMHCFLSSIVKGEICLVEHEAAKWLAPDELDSVDWRSSRSSRRCSDEGLEGRRRARFGFEAGLFRRRMRRVNIRHKRVLRGAGLFRCARVRSSVRRSFATA